MTTIKQRVIQHINNTIGTEFNVHSFNFGSYNRVYNILRNLFDAGYLSRRKVANRHIYWTQKQIPKTIRQDRPSIRPYQITVYLTQENSDYLNQFKNKSAEVDRILCSANFDNIQRRYKRDTVKIRLSISEAAYGKLRSVPSSYVNEAIEQYRSVNN